MRSNGIVGLETCRSRDEYGLEDRKGRKLDEDHYRDGEEWYRGQLEQAGTMSWRLESGGLSMSS